MQSLVLFQQFRFCLLHFQSPLFNFNLMCKYLERLSQNNESFHLYFRYNSLFKDIRSLMLHHLLAFLRREKKNKFVFQRFVLPFSVSAMEGNSQRSNTYLMCRKTFSLISVHFKYLQHDSASKLNWQELMHSPDKKHTKTNRKVPTNEPKQANYKVLFHCNLCLGSFELTAIFFCGVQNEELFWR